jgi:hypothetical protein
MKSNGITNYSDHFDLRPYREGVHSTFNRSRLFHQIDRVDTLWSGDQTAPIRNTAPKGWDIGTWKALHLWHTPYDPGYKGLDNTPAHRLMREIKDRFNLPHKLGTHKDGDIEAWKNEYTCHPHDSEFMHWTSANCASFPMVMEPSAFNNPVNTDARKLCELNMHIYGNDGYVVRPDMKDRELLNDHYRGLVEAGTPAKDFTDPPLIGKEFEESGDITLVNCQNYYRPKKVGEETLSLKIAWYGHTYDEIKELMDASIGK